MERPRTLLVLGLVAVALFAVLAASIASGHDGGIQGIDDSWRRLVGQHPGSITSNPVVLAFQTLGRTRVSIVVSVLIPLMLLLLRRRWAALYALVLFAFSGGVMNYAMKLIVARPRQVAEPALGLAGPLFGEQGADSFPSGHTSLMVTILLVVLVAAQGRARTIGGSVAGVLVVCMVLERTMVNAHWLSDTFGGILGVGAVGLLLWWWMEPRLAVERKRLDTDARHTAPTP